MGKRKFKKPEDSDSEYEWEEAKPKTTHEPEIKQSKDDDLSGFLNKYSSKSRNEMRKEKIEEEKDKQAKVYENRIYKSTEIMSPKFDSQWLKKSFNRCKEQAKNDGLDLITLLRDRYDDKTIDFMMKNFSGVSKLNSKHDKIYNKYHEKTLPNDEYNYEKKSSDIVEERYVTESDINEACASLMKAEMLGNTSKIKKLEKQVNTLREAQKRNLKIRLTRQRKPEDDNNEDKKRHVLLEKSLKSGKMIPYLETRNQFVSQSRPNEARDTKLSDLIREENMTNADEADLTFARMTAKLHYRTKDRDEITENEYNDRFMSRSNDKRDLKFSEKSKQNAISAQKYRSSQVSNCVQCYERISKHLVLSKGSYFCLIVPANLGLIDYHLQLVPLDHVAATTQIVDDDMWSELVQFKSRIVEFFTAELNSETVFLETVLGLGKFPHTVIECVPISLDRSQLNVSIELFFKKSIDEAKSEWCQNRGLLDLKEGDIRRTVPRGFAYFSVAFGLGAGFAFVIENEQKMSPRFGLEIAGSILGLNEIDMASRRHGNGFNEQADLCLRIEKRWKPYNLWQQSPDSGDDSD